MYDPTISEEESHYLAIESTISKAANENLIHLLTAPASDIAAAIEEELAHAEQADKLVTQASGEDHPFYEIMAERIAEGLKLIRILRELLPYFQKGDDSNVMEAVAVTAALKGVCSTIDFAMEAMY